MWLEGSLNENCFPNVLFNIISRVSTDSVDRFQSTAGGDVLNFDELMHKDCRNSWKSKKNKITVSHEGGFLGCRKIQILSAADLQEVWVYLKAQARWKMLPKLKYEKIGRREWHILHGLQPAFWIECCWREIKKNYFFFSIPSLCTVLLTKYKLGGLGWLGNMEMWLTR